MGFELNRTLTDEEVTARALAAGEYELRPEGGDGRVTITAG